MRKYEYMQEILKENNGYLFTSQIEKEFISRTYLSKFLRYNNMEKVAK